MNTRNRESLTDSIAVVGAAMLLFTVGSNLAVNFKDRFNSCMAERTTPTPKLSAALSREITQTFRQISLGMPVDDLQLATAIDMRSKIISSKQETQYCLAQASGDKINLDNS